MVQKSMWTNSILNWIQRREIESAVVYPTIAMQGPAYGTLEAGSGVLVDRSIGTAACQETGEYRRPINDGINSSSNFKQENAMHDFWCFGSSYMRTRILRVDVSLSRKQKFDSLDLYPHV